METTIWGLGLRDLNVAEVPVKAMSLDSRKPKFKKALQPGRHQTQASPMHCWEQLGWLPV